jgi:hypothetical protein
MANTLISNALTRSFRASTYNLGNNISNTVVVNTSLGDVQYGTISGNTTIQFAGWAPSGTQSNVQLQLNIANSDAGRQAVISFPTQVSLVGSYGVETLENFSNVGNVPTVTIPYGVTQLEYRLSTIDCGNNITIEPYNRPRITTQVQQRTPAPTGFPGDVAGDIAVDTNYVYVCTGSFDSTSVVATITNTYAGNLIDCTATISSLVENAPIVFTGNTWGNIVANTVYYIKSKSSGNITISSTGFDGTAGSTFAVAEGSGEMRATSYNGNSIWKSIALAGSSSANQTISGSLTIGGLLAVSCNDNITAAGTIQTNATLLTDNINIVTTVPSNSGVILPIAVAGYRIIVRNNSASTLRVYPNIGANINGGTSNVSVTLSASASIEYFCSTSAVANIGGNWYTLNSAYA